VRRPADYPLPPALPKVIDDPVVTQAIDLFKKPTLGKPWNASGGTVPQSLRAIPFITPCGVLVTVIQTDSSTQNPTTLSQTSIIGYDIASGQQKWSFGLQQATGLKDPVYDTILSTGATYTSDCYMVLNFREHDRSNIGYSASLFIHLDDGKVTSLPWSQYQYQHGSCAAAGAGWAGCQTERDAISMAFKLDGSTKAVWTKPATRYGYAVTIAGYIMTDAGYSDPATGRVAFGADIAKGNDAVWYVEPRRPGDYRSGLVVRVSGPISEGIGQCQVALWDPATDQSAWATPGTIDCGADHIYKLAVAGQALIVSSGVMADDPTNKAFSLADGSLLWQRDGSRLGAGWDNRLGYSDSNADSLSETYAFLTVETGSGYDDLAIRIADGVETNLIIKRYTITWPLTVAAGVMAYDLRYSGLTAYTIDANKPDAPPSKAWSIPIDTTNSNRWSFATGGVMYLVTDQRDSLTITPLLS